MLAAPLVRGAVALAVVTTVRTGSGLVAKLPGVSFGRAAGSFLSHIPRPPSKKGNGITRDAGVNGVDPVPDEKRAPRGPVPDRIGKEKIAIRTRCQKDGADSNIGTGGDQGKEPLE
jgi:hypothetical protein